MLHLSQWIYLIKFDYIFLYIHDHCYKSVGITYFNNNNNPMTSLMSFTATIVKPPVCFEAGISYAEGMVLYK